MDLLNAHEDGKIDMRRVEFVGPQVGEELANDGGLAMIYALICILVYVGFRFEYRLAVGSVMALVHDVVITLGVFSLFQLDFDLTVLAAILAVIGYSLNDTIVVFDRIRENFRKMRKGTSEEVINVSLNQTLSRTVITSFTTLRVARRCGHRHLFLHLRRQFQCPDAGAQQGRPDAGGGGEGRRRDRRPSIARLA